MPGTVVVDVEAGSESPWEAIERRYHNHALGVTISFCRGSAVASSAWPEKQGCVGNIRRTTVSEVGAVWRSMMSRQPILSVRGMMLGTAAGASADLVREATREY